MSIYEVAMRMLGSDSRKLLGLITASLVLARLGKPCATRSGGPLRFYASKGMLQRKRIREQWTFEGGLDFRLRKPHFCAESARPDDRHVLAAALHARAELIITINLKDFSAAALSPHSIVAANPDAFVDDLFDLDERAAIAAIAKMRSRLRAPSLSPADFVDSIHARIPVVLVPVRPAYST